MEIYNCEDFDELRPITSKRQAGCFIDLLLSPKDRIERNLAIIPLDEEGFPIKEAIIMIRGVPWSLSVPLIEEFLRHIVEIPFPRIILAMSNRNRPPMEILRRWSEVAARTYTPDAGKELMGFFCAYVSRVIAMPAARVIAPKKQIA